MYIKQDIQELIYGCIHDGHNKYNHCHQGARRAALVSMFTTMVSTRCTGDEAYEYIKGLRNIVEDNCREVCRKFSEDRAVWLEWLDDDEIVPLPCMVLPQEMQAIFQGEKTCEVQHFSVKGCSYRKWVLVNQTTASSQVNQTTASSQGTTQPKQMPKKEAQTPGPRAAEIGERFEEGKELRPPGMPGMMPPQATGINAGSIKAGKKKGAWQNYEGMPSKVLNNGFECAEEDEPPLKRRCDENPGKEDGQLGETRKDGELDKSRRSRWNAKLGKFLPRRDESPPRQGVWRDPPSVDDDAMTASMSSEKTQVDDGEHGKEEPKMNQVDDGEHVEKTLSKEEADRLAVVREQLRNMSDETASSQEETNVLPVEPPQQTPEQNTSLEQDQATEDNQKLQMTHMQDMMKKMEELMTAYKQTEENVQNFIKEEVERRLCERDSDNAPPQYIPQQTTVFDQDADRGLLAAEKFYEMLLQKNFEGAKQWLQRKVDQNVEFDMFLTYRDSSELNVAHLLAFAVQPELAEFIVDHAPDTWKHLVNTQTRLARTPGGWTPLHSLADTPHKGIPQSRISHMVHCVVYPCVWETLVKQNNKGHTFLHLAGLRGNEWFVRYSLDAMAVHYTDEHIKTLLNMVNNKSQSVADASVHNAIIKNMILSKKGEHNLPAPPSWKFNSWIPTDHRWNRKNPSRQTLQQNGLWPGCGDTGQDKAECGNDDNHGHGGGWGDEGGTGHSRVWKGASKSRSTSRSWTHSEWRGSHESYGSSDHEPRRAKICKSPRSRSRG